MKDLVLVDHHFSKTARYFTPWTRIQATHLPSPSRVRHLNIALLCLKLRSFHSFGHPFHFKVTRPLQESNLAIPVSGRHSFPPIPSRRHHKNRSGLNNGLLVTYDSLSNHPAHTRLLPYIHWISYESRTITKDLTRFMLLKCPKFIPIQLLIVKPSHR